MMSAMLRRLPLVLALLGLSGCAASQQPPATPQPQAQAARHITAAASLVDQSARTLREMRKATRDRMLDAAIESARAVIVLPGVYQAGFFYSVHGGGGVLIARRADGGWGSPVFVSVAGAGYGLQAGLEKSRLVLAVMEEEMLERILTCGLNFDASATYDILGVREQTGPSSLTEERPVMAFADGVGIMAGIAMRGGVLSVNKPMTQSYHGISADDIEKTMRGISAPGVEAFDLWAALGVVPVAPHGGDIAPPR
jgi:lipid-binding SYLF domain-containing protein